MCQLRLVYLLVGKEVCSIIGIASCPEEWKYTYRNTVTGPRIHPDATLTLALPKTGFLEVGGEILLGDIGVPASVFSRLGIYYRKPFRENFVVGLVNRPENFEGGSKA